MDFKELELKEPIVRALEESGITSPTKIQQDAIPLALSGNDIVGVSKTGSGKTAAFSLPVLQNINPGQGMQALVMAPTRELAQQIAQEMQKFGKYLGIQVSTVYGGVAIGPQTQALKTSDIIVATPGRMIDHLERGNINFDQLNYFVLDEADKMVEMGFVEDIERLLEYVPRDGQVLLFGATISTEINRIKEQYMIDPQTVKAEVQVKEDLLEQYYYTVEPHEKFSLLVHFLQKEDTDRVIVFCSARSTVELVAKNLKAQGIKAALIHGKLAQNKRLRVIEDFNKGRPKILVASSVAARGLHVENVSHVFNYDISQDPQEYVHRVGRTARAGESGKAITLLSRPDFDKFNRVCDRYKLNVEQLPQERFPKLRFNRFLGGSPGGGRGRSGGFRSGRTGHRGPRRSFSRGGSFRGR